MVAGISEFSSDYYQAIWSFLCLYRGSGWGWGYGCALCFFYDDKIAWYENDGSGNFGAEALISTLQVEHGLSMRRFGWGWGYGCALGF